MNAKDKWHTIIPLLGLALGMCLAGILVWDGVRSVSNYKYCTVLDEDFSQGFRSDVWTREVQVGGFGNGQFEQTTASDENSFVKNGILYIKPTLQNSSLVETDGTIIDLRNAGCTGTHWWDCVATTNTTNGTIVNPVRSARLTTRLNASIMFGRVEVEAKLPQGDWLWPAIWMLPRDNVYGEWPRSGELDIAESRGNNYTYHQGGNNIVSSTLHYGPDSDNDGWWRNNVKRKASHTTFSSGFNTFGVEWTPNYIFTYVNSRLVQTLYHPLTSPLWSPSHFPYISRNGTRLTNPWAISRNPNKAPFDQPFYLVLSLAVGATNGWFEDGESGKPWVDASAGAKRDFWRARGEWGRSWGCGSVMQVRRVRMWQQVGWEGCREEDGVRVF
ncbi:glycoside hydrolase family 16 protein [Periconia macrospinosa]|uniref:Glycoside hydrolase family 16 protein n=1 Tax=Periconia macrospinosa TaxID=97972 RepID=A0A2V1D229_9PLEO|nr:glycoside hydrolase family 16 protein [Periconia macrospinosa]